MSPPRGRPKKTSLERVQTVVWCRAVIGESGLTPYALEKKFSWPGTQETFRQTSLWKKYLNGTATPGKSASTLGLIERVDEQYPETARIFYHPLWRALDPAVLTHIELRALFLALPMVYQDVVFVAPGWNRFWRKPRRDASEVDEIAHPSFIDQLAYVACLLREAEIVQDARGHSDYLVMLFRLMKDDTRQDRLMSGVTGQLAAELAIRWRETIYPREGRSAKVAVFKAGVAGQVELSIVDCAKMA